MCCISNFEFRISDFGFRTANFAQGDIAHRATRHDDDDRLMLSSTLLKCYKVVHPILPSHPSLSHMPSTQPQIKRTLNTQHSISNTPDLTLNTHHSTHKHTTLITQHSNTQHHINIKLHTRDTFI